MNALSGERLRTSLFTVGHAWVVWGVAGCAGGTTYKREDRARLGDTGSWPPCVGQWSLVLLKRSDANSSKESLQTSLSVVFG